jgi:glycosyltransferase involved in cell wall biosynthesis
MSLPPTVLYVSHETECGGAEISLVELMRGLDRSRFRPVLVTSAEGPLAERAREAAVVVHLVEMRRRLGWPGAARTLARLARKEFAALVHANTLRAGYVTSFLPQPRVWHVRDMSYPWLARWACRRADRVVANSQAAADTLGVAPDRLRIVFNGVDPRCFEDHDRALRGEAAPDTVLVGILGRIDPLKGHEVLLDALARTTANVRLWVVGDVAFDRYRDYRASLEARVPAGRAEFLGWRDDLPEILAALDIVVQPSTGPEAFGRAAAEAQAAGKPVVATRLGGLAEVVDDGVTGVLVPPGDAGALAEAIEALANDTERRATMGAAGRERAQRLFTRAAHAHAIQAIYDELLTSAAAPLSGRR